MTFFRNEMTVKFHIEWGRYPGALPGQEKSGLTRQYFENCSLAGHAG
jgi:hypothetical protein